MNIALLIGAIWLLSLVSMPAVRTVAARLEIGSLPAPRKMNRKFMPVLGGVGIVFAVCGGLLAGNLLGWIRTDIWTFRPYFWTGLGVIVLTGLLDDIHGLNSFQKILGETLAAALLVFGGCEIEALLAPGDAIIHLGILGVPFTVLWIVFIINAVNLLDGLDGLAGGVTFICLLGFAFFAWSSSQWNLLILILAFAAAILGFLKYNSHPASLFMGDVGSLQLGFLLAFFSIETLKVAGSHHVQILSSIIVLGLPIGDTIISFLRRLSRGVHPFKPDRDHTHHRLIQLGLTHRQTVWILYLFAFVFTVTGILMYLYSGATGILLFFMAVGLAVFSAWRVGYLEVQPYSTFFNGQLAGVSSRIAPLRWNRFWHQLLIFSGDILAINFSLFITIWFKFESGLMTAARPETIANYLADPVFLFVTVAWALLFWLNGLYRMPWDVSRFDKVLRVSKIILFGVLVIGFVTADWRQTFNSDQLSILLFYAVVMLVSVNGVRLAIIEAEKRLQIFEYSPKKSLIIGTGRIAKNLILDITSNPHLIYDIRGIVEKKRSHSEFEGFPVLGNTEQLSAIIQSYQIEEVIIALNRFSNEDLVKITGICNRMQVMVKTVPGIHGLLYGHDATLASHGLVKIFPDRIVLWQWIVKRVMDWGFALANIILFSPVWIIIAISIKVKFGKSVIVPVKILGKHAKPFNMFLFRLTDDGSEAEIDPVYFGTKKRGPFTGLGRFLFTTRLYKFPLILNILRGEMSLVGPRPEPIQWYQSFQSELPIIYRRLMVRPGFTGLAQVKYRYEYSQHYLKERLNTDLYYIDNMSINMDFRVILRSLILMVTLPGELLRSKK